LTVLSRLIWPSAGPLLQASGAVLCPLQPGVEALRLAPAHQGRELLREPDRLVQRAGVLAQSGQQRPVFRAPALGPAQRGPRRGARRQHPLGRRHERRPGHASGRIPSEAEAVDAADLQARHVGAASAWVVSAAVLSGAALQRSRALSGGG
jgi:hypothetical protein